LVLVTASLSVTTVAAILLASPLLSGGRWSQPGPERARRFLARDVTVWVGDLAPDFKAVVGAVWGDAGSDAAHDAMLNDDLGLTGDDRLAWYHLLLFNTGVTTRTVDLGDGALAFRTADGAEVPLVSLADLTQAGHVQPPASLATVLRALGTLERRADVPPATMVHFMVPFAARVDTSPPDTLIAANGATLERRLMSRRDLERLIADPATSHLGALR
jgi:hypothetical protein